MSSSEANRLAIGQASNILPNNLNYDTLVKNVKELNYNYLIYLLVTKAGPAMGFRFFSKFFEGPSLRSDE